MAGSKNDPIQVEITGDATVGTATAAADAESNATAVGTTRSRLFGFNGTTWDRLRTGLTAVSSTLTGMLNTLPWAVYKATPTTRTDGQGGPIISDAKGNLRVVAVNAPVFSPVRYYNAGSALAADSDPNTAEPDPSRVVTIPADGPQFRWELLAAVIGGTSCTARPWVWAANQSKWLPASSATATLTASANAAFMPVGTASKKCFVQLVANTGVTELYYGLV